ncbi:MAG: hypothetical protein U0800_17515 [Isosphaeraceae bacterium]
MPPIGTKNLVMIVGVLALGAAFLYVLVYISEAKLQLIVTVAAVGGGCYAIGLNQDSRYSRREIERMEAENRALQEKVRALKEMYLEDRVPARAPEPMPAPAPMPSLPADTITIRGGAIRDFIGKLMPGSAPTPGRPQIPGASASTAGTFGAAERVEAQPTPTIRDSA